MLKKKNAINGDTKSELETKYAWYQLKTHPNAI